MSILFMSIDIGIGNNYLYCLTYLEYYLHAQYLYDFIYSGKWWVAFASLNILYSSKAHLCHLSKIKLRNGECLSARFHYFFQVHSLIKYTYGANLIRKVDKSKQKSDKLYFRFYCSDIAIFAASERNNPHNHSWLSKIVFIFVDAETNKIM